MNKSKIAGVLGINRSTLQDWVRRGCPVGRNGKMDAVEVVKWRTARKLSREGESGTELPELVGTVTRRLLDVDERTRKADAMPPGTTRAATRWALILEKTLLEIPGRVLVEARPETLPVDVHKIIIRALDEARR